MSKTPTGAALIAYGPTLPTAATTADGALFYKTETNGGIAQGLYVFGYVRDSNTGIIGPQVLQQWSPITASSGGGPIDATTLNGLGSTAFQLADSDLTALANSSTTGWYVRTGAGTSATRSFVAGSGVTITNANGVSGNPTFTLDSSSLNLNTIAGTLDVNKGGTGATTLTGYLKGNGTAAFTAVSAIPGGDISGAVANATNAASANSATTAGSATTANYATSAGSATTATTAASAQTLKQNGTGPNMTFNYATGTGQPTYLWGDAGAGTNSYVYTPASLQIGYAAQLTTARTISLTGPVTGSTTFDGSANVSISTTASGLVLKAGDTMTGSLNVTGNITATGNVTAYSDIRLKTNLELISNPLQKVQALRGVNFTRISDDVRGTGLIAQDVLEVLPEAVLENEDGMLSVAYGNVVGLLVEAIKTQQKQISALQKQVQKLMK